MIVSIPFGGKVIGSIIYRRVIVLGTKFCGFRGVIIPVVSTINVRIVASLITAISMALILEVREGEKVIMQ
ncbi:MAG: hypothetical protein RXR43_08845 [Sulfolobus sp.]